MDINWTDIILAIISLIGTVLMAVLVPYIRTKTTEVQRDKIQNLVSIAVQAAEQIFNLPKMGEQKKDYVMDYIQSKGYNISREDLNVYIEAAVNELNSFNNAVFN